MLKSGGHEQGISRDYTEVLIGAKRPIPELWPERRKRGRV